MGRGDDIAIVDANFPATALTTRLVRMDGASAVSLLGAILELLPIVNFESDPVRTMRVVADLIAGDCSAIESRFIDQKLQYSY